MANYAIQKRQRSYYKYECRDWTQPVLTANGTLGGTSFACFVGSNYPGNHAYCAFDGKDTTAWASNLIDTQDYIGFYNPEPLLVSEIVCTNKLWITGLWEVYGSNNNRDYELIASGENTDATDGATFTIDLSTNEKPYKYYKIQCLTTIANKRVGMGEIKITAQELMDIIEVPASDITDFGSYKYYKNVVTTKYWKEITPGSKELAYACYFCVWHDLSWYGYAKIPVGSDLTVYKENDGGLATSADKLLASSTFDSVTEKSAVESYSLMGVTHTYNYNRQYENDLYIDTTVTETVEGTPEDYTYTTEEIVPVEGTPEDYTYTTEEIVPVEVTANDDYDFTEFVPSTEFDYHVDRERFYNFTKRNREYYKYGTELDATAEGTFATIYKGVARGFSTADYLLTTKNFTSTPNTRGAVAKITTGSPTPNTWEAVAKITTGSDVKTLQFIFGNGGVSWRMSVCVTGGHFAANLSSNNSSWNIASTSGAYTVLANTNYWVKLKYTRTQYVLEYSTDGDVWNEDLVINNPKPIYSVELPLSIGANKHRDGVNYPFLGSIDLNETYININGKRWWSGDKYTKVGSWIDESVAGSFTTAKYLVNNKGIFNTKQPWESVISFTTGSDISTTQVICCNTVGYWGYGVGVQSGKLHVGLSSSTSGYNIIENKDIDVLANTKYWVRTVFNGENYTCTYSTDGKNYLEVFSLDSTTAVSSGIPRYGLADSGKTPFLGIIDFNESYIKIDGEFWWRGIEGIGGGTYTATDGWGNVANAFDHVSNTYATCGTSTDYIEYVFGREVYINGFTATGQFASSAARPMDLRIYSVDDDGNETLLGNGTGCAATSVYTTKATFPRVKTSKVRFRLTETSFDGNPPSTSAPTRIREIRMLGSIIGTESDYDYYIDRHKFYNLIYKPYDVISETFNISDEIQTYVVPEDVYSLNIFCAASAGYSATCGDGGAVKCDLVVTPGQILYVTVGNRPTTYNTAVYNASDIRIDGTELENRIIVAGGGGTGRNNKGGAGGGLVGGDAVGVGYQKGAFGGTQEAGGGASYRSGGNTDGWAAGSAGTYAMGGNGAKGSMYNRTVLGGCGGAGYYGGGGGGVYDIRKVGVTYAGGGGGSSYTDASLCKNVVHYQGVIKEDGYVKISYIKER